jgi:hypothetical protein
MMILLLAIVVIASGIALVRAIPHDGYGTRPGPRSHIDPFDPRRLV